jgi:hypothetical protein
MLLLLLVATLNTPQAHDWYAYLLAEGGYGQLDERAAFLITEADGTLTLQPWPRGGVRHATFRGSIPLRTIAIVHTHPRRDPRPSAQDRAEARRLGIAVVVVTPSGVIAALPEGGVSVIAERMPVRASGTSRAPSARRTSLPR